MMKKIVLLFFFFIFCFQFSYSQNQGEWVWLRGDSAGSFLGNFGTQGVPSANNEPPGLYEACEWTDVNGNFWLYGGQGISDLNAALWKYDPLTNEWTWVKGPSSTNFQGNLGIQGIPSPSNLPSSRVAMASWTDSGNNLWMLGGAGSFNNSPFNALWKYDIGTNEWTWMQGWGSNAVYGTKGMPDTANTLGGRVETAATWTEGDTSNNGDNLWLFGGEWGGGMNDLWKYSIQTNSWTWMKGTNLGNQPGIYGILGVEDSTNVPGGRWVYSRWKDKKGNFWIFGGVDSIGLYNDLWRYNLKTNNWTWISGSNSINSYGNYGTICTIAPTNIPQARYENRAVWTDDYGNFWTFGGIHPLNDLWIYCTAINQWVWVSNDSVPIFTCSWGSKGVSSPSNKPGARWGALSWYDHKGHFYLFGGSGFYTSGGTNNDLWEYTIDTTCYCPSVSANISEAQSDNSISVYPNPLTSSSILQLNTQLIPNESGAEVIIYDIVGKEMMRKKLAGDRMEIEKGNLASGVYFVKVRSEEGQWVEKMVVE